MTDQRSNSSIHPCGAGDEELGRRHLAGLGIDERDRLAGEVEGRAGAVSLA